MDKCIKITGGLAASANGLTALTESGQLTSIGNFTISARWRPSASIVAQDAGAGADANADQPAGKTAPAAAATPATPATPPAPLGLSGNNTNGIVVYSGRKSRYLGSVDNLQAEWIDQPDFEADIGGMVGERVSGITAFSAAGPAGQDSVVAQLVIGDDNKPAWKRKTAPPFAVSLMAGDSVGGVLILGVADGVTSLARSGPDCNCDWKNLPPLLFKVQMVTGDWTNGFVFAGAGQMVSMDPKQVLTKLPPLNFAITAMTGNPKDGIAAILEGGVIASCTDLSKAVWTVLGGPIGTTAATPAPATASAPTAPTAATGSDNKNPAATTPPQLAGTGASKAAASVTTKEVESATA